MNYEINSFPNMYDMLQAKVDHLAGRFNIVKKHLKPACLGGHESWFPSFGRTVCQTICTRSTCRLPLITLGYNGSNQLYVKSVASKVTSQQGVTSLLHGDAEKCEKTPLFVKRSVTENFQYEIFLGRRLSEPPHTQLGLTSNWFDQKNYEGRGISRYFETDQDPNQPRRACVHSLGNLLKLFDRQGLDCYACLVTAFWRERCIFS